MSPQPKRLLGVRATFVLETTALILLGLAIWCFRLPIGRSEAVMAEESAALDVLAEIARAEEIASLPVETPEGVQRSYLLAADLAARLPADLGESIERGAAEFSSHPGSVSGAFAHGGYCFVVYLAAARGEAVAEADGRALRAGFWIAYAWPLVYGKTGRRVFVRDSYGSLKFFDNETGRYSGLRVCPPPPLYKPDVKSWPIEEKMTGWERSIKWWPL